MATVDQAVPTRSQLPAAPRTPAPWVVHLGMAGVFGFALFAFLGIAGANIGIALMLVALVLDRHRFWPVLRRDPSLPLLVWTMAAVGLSAGVRVWRFPDELAVQWDGVLDVLQLFLFLPVAWWLQGRQQLIFLALALALTGFTLGAFRALGPSDLAALIAWQRPHFMYSINAFGQYAAACLLGMGIMTPRYWRWLKRQTWRWIGLFGWFTLMVLAGAAVVLSLSRGVWLALALAASGVVVNLIWVQRRERAGGRGLTTAVAIGVVLSVGLFYSSDAVRNRAVAIVQPIVQLFAAEGRVEEVSDRSDRTRAKLLVLGLRSWWASPWFGSGPAAPEQIIRDHREQFPRWKSYSDFHNVAVDMLASFGVVGSLPLLLTFALVLGVAFRGFRSGRLDIDLYLVLVGLLTLSALAQMTDTRILSSHGRFYSMLMAGAAYSWWLAWRGESAADSPSASR